MAGGSRRLELVVGAAMLLLTLSAFVRMTRPASQTDVGSTELSARIAKLEPIADRVNELEAALLAHAKSNKDKFDEIARMRPAKGQGAAAMQRRDVEEEEVESSSLSTLSAVPDEGPAAHRTDCATAVLPTGLPARTKREVMEKSKADKQYGMGITETGMDKPGNLVNSAAYWESRYAMGGNSGAGSYNQIGVFKAEIVNNFVKANGVRTVVEFGFGDGQQLTRAEYPHYIGLDVSKTIHEKTSKRFKDDSAKEFRLYNGKPVPGLKEDLTLSFDVIYHLVEDNVFHDYMAALFAASTKYVIVYSSNIEGWHGAAHVLHRDVTGYIAKTFPNWKLLGTLRNRYPERTAQDFFFYGKCGDDE